MKQLQTFWDGLDPRRRLIAALSVVAILAAVFGISRVATAPSMAMLYSGLDSAAAGEVVAELEAEGVAFEVDGGSILVESAARDRIRMAARRQGAAGRRARRLRDPRQPLGLRHHQPDVRRRLLARQGGRARPHHHRLAERARRAGAPREPGQPAVLAHPRRLGLGDGDDGPRRARPRPGRGDPLPRLLGGRRHRARGGGGDRLGARRGARRQGGRASTAPAASPNERAETLRANIQRLLEARVGPGRAIVEVNVDADMDSQTISERTIDPDSRVAISSRDRGRAPRTPPAPRRA